MGGQFSTGAWCPRRRWWGVIRAGGGEGLFGSECHRDGSSADWRSRRAPGQPPLRTVAVERDAFRGDLSTFSSSVIEELLNTERFRSGWRSQHQGFFRIKGYASNIFDST